MGNERFSNLVKKCFHILLGRLDQQLAVVLPDVVTEKVKALFDARYYRLFFR